jgi:hypothetical protein
MDSAVEAIPDAADAHDVSGLGRLWFDFVAELDDVLSTTRSIRNEPGPRAIIE